MSQYQHEILRGRIVPGMSFHEKVWAMTVRVPRGKVVTYAQVARALGSQGYRAVGGALNRNPFAPGVPCHRVVGSTGSLTGFAGGLDRKLEMLLAEGVPCQSGKVQLSDECRHDFH